MRPPVAAPAIELTEVRSEPRMFVLPAGHPLAAREELSLADVAGLPFVTADLATDGCEPRAWRDDWLITPRPGGDVPIIGATARTVDDWCEHVPRFVFSRTILSRNTGAWPTSLADGATAHSCRQKRSDESWPAVRSVLQER